MAAPARGQLSNAGEFLGDAGASTEGFLSGLNSPQVVKNPNLPFCVGS